MQTTSTSSALSRRFVYGLALGTIALALGLLVMLAVFQRQAQTLQGTARLHTDSVTAVSFQLEREYFRLRHQLHLSLAQPQQADWQQLQARYEIFAQRILALQDGAPAELLRQRPEYAAVTPKLRAMLVQFDPLMAEPQLHQAQLQLLLQQLEALGPEVKALSLSANSLMTQLMDEKLAVVQQQQTWIQTLLLLQALGLLLAAVLLFLRNQRQMRQQQALERVNEGLRQASEAARQAELAKGQFLANMSHELRTPLNGVLGMLDLLQDSPLDQAQREQIVLARQSSRHLLRIINDVLDLSALDAGELKILSEPVNMLGLLQEVHDMLLGQARRQGVELKLQLPEEASVWVLADPTRVRQVLLNLLSNAIKFAPRGLVQLQSNYRYLSPQRVAWKISVRDNGVGLGAQEQSQLFQRFRQIDSGRSRRFGGTGLGLEISRSLARLMGGDITVVSALGQGSEFSFEFETPLTAPPSQFAPTRSGVLFAPDSALPTFSPSESDALPGEQVAAAAWHVLVAEDHAANRTLMRLMLERLGYRVSFAENGAQALQLARLQSFDAILMDLHMPEMDGVRSSAAIRALGGVNARVPIIALSADVMPETQRLALEAGMNAFLSKPVLRHALQNTLAQCILAAQMQAQAPQEQAAGLRVQP